MNAVDDLVGIVTKTDISKALGASQYPRYALPVSSRILTTSINIFFFLQFICYPFITPNGTNRATFVAIPRL